MTNSLSDDIKIGVVVGEGGDRSIVRFPVVVLQEAAGARKVFPRSLGINKNVAFDEQFSGVGGFQMFDKWTVRQGNGRNVVYTIDDAFDGMFRIRAQAEGTSVIYVDLARSTDRRVVERTFNKYIESCSLVQATAR